MTDPQAQPPISDRYYYPHEPQREKTRLVLETYEYEMPFKYANITPMRWFQVGREGHGVEMGPINTVPQEGLKDAKSYPADCIVIREPHPIVRVAVIGSACTPPGFVQLECEPLPEWRKDYEYHSVLPVRFRADNLWGMHLRIDTLYAQGSEVTPKVPLPQGQQYEKMPERIKQLYPSTSANPHRAKSHYAENPLAGMSCAIFEIPPSLSVSISGGSASTGWASDNFPADNHYSFRTVRTTVMLRKEPVQG